MCRVLVVDDEEYIIRMVGHALKKHFVESATNIQDARSIITSKNPDILIVDLMVPGDSGEDLIRESDTDDIVIVITGKKLGADEEARLIEIGATSVLRKPFSVRHLRAIVDRLYSNSGGDCGMKSDKTLSFITRMAESTKSLKRARFRLEAHIPQKAVNHV